MTVNNKPLSMAPYENIWEKEKERKGRSLFIDSFAYLFEFP